MATGYDEAAYYKRRDPEKEKIIRLLIRLILNARRPMTVHEVASQNHWKDKDLKRFLDGCAEVFDVYQDGQHEYVKVICPLSICDVHCAKNKQCSGRPPECSGLHVCKFYILSDTCRFAQKCLFGHDLTMPHNAAILGEHLLDGVSVEEIKHLMKQTGSRTSSTLPKICKFYNHHTGCRNTMNGKPCPFLHVCKHYVQDCCQFGKNCKRSHNLMDPEVLTVLSNHGINTRRTPKEILTDLREAMDPVSGSETSSVDTSPFRAATRFVGGQEMSPPMRGLEGLAQMSINPQQMRRQNGQAQKSVNQQQTPGSLVRAVSEDGSLSPTICLYQLKGRCAYGKSCHNEHCDKQYMWLYRLITDRYVVSAVSEDGSLSQTICLYQLKGRCAYGKSCHNEHCDKPYMWLYRLITDRYVVSAVSEDGSLSQTICLYQLKGRCAYGKSCHNEHCDKPYMWLYRLITDRSVVRAVSEDGSLSQTICLYQLKGRCAYGKSCHNEHCDKPYMWLYRLITDRDWVPVDTKQNVEIEMTYCDVKEKDHVLVVQGGQLWVDFNKMAAQHSSTKGFNYEIRRLSTVSSVEMANQPLATLWVWAWKTQMGDWMEYGVDADGYRSNIQSSDIEQAYMANPEGQMKFATQGHEYVLDFRRMLQCNLEYNTQREVRRRPAFVSPEDVKEKIKQASQPRRPPRTPSKKSQAAATPPVPLVTAPKHWNVGEDVDVLDHYDLIKLSRRDLETRLEYKEIEAMFCETMPSTAAITSIIRIQNGDLWTNYISKKNKMEKRSRSEVNERRLFHGTQSQYVDAICRQGFDFRLCGQSTGTAYGKGSYFATTAQYSNCYTTHGDHMLFVVKVLVGDYVKGKSNYVRPPPKRPTEPLSELYDSCVDDAKVPKIFVIFDNNGQVYPEYVIGYDMKFQV